MIPPRIVWFATSLTLASALFLQAATGLPRDVPQAEAAGSWMARGAFADQEFTSIVSPPGFPCVVAFTALQNGGLGVSTDCGVQYANLIATNAYSVIAKDINVGWVAAGTAGVVKSVNGGANFFPVNDGLPPLHDARAILTDLNAPDTVFCGLYGGGVFKGVPFADSLESWSPMNVGLGDLRIRQLVRVRGGTFFLAATDGGIWKWQGGSWSASSPGGVVANRLLIDSADSSRVYAAGPAGVHRSLDGGQTFFPSSTGLPVGVVVNEIVRRTDAPSVLYVGLRGSGIYESLDFGATWRPFGPPVPGENDVRSLLAVVDGSTANVFAGTRRDGLFELEYSTPTVPTTWSRLKARYR